MTCRLHDERVPIASDFDGDPSYAGYFVSLVVPFKVLLFLGVILNLKAHYTIFTTVTQEGAARIGYAFVANVVSYN